MTDPYYTDDAVTLYHGDCLEVLTTLPDNSVDACVTDPPYGIEFMGREWDSFRIDDPGTNRHRGDRASAPKMTHDASTAPRAPDKPWQKERSGYVAGKRAATNQCAGCGKRDQFRNPHACPTSTPWESILINPHAAPPASLAFQAWCQLWAAECLRVLKPGGHLLAFGGTRTWHRLACAIEDAGFEIRDSIAWLYGSGFPKSLAVDKAIDRVNGKPLDRLREFGVYVRTAREAAGLTQAGVNRAMNMPQGCGWWEGKGLGDKWDLHLPSLATWQLLKTVVTTLDGEWDWLIEWAEAEREVVGARTTGLGTGNGSVQIMGDGTRAITAPATADAQRWQGWGTALKPAHEPIVVARRPLSGTVAANVLAHGTGALNIDGGRIGSGGGTKGAGAGPRGAIYDQRPDSPDSGLNGTFGEVVPGLGRWPANVALDEAAAAALDHMSGERPSGGSPSGQSENHGLRGNTFTHERTPRDADMGGASRFYFTAKAGSDERITHGGVAHPTVKPLALMRWLVRLVTPPGGVILEPFAGSGTTVEACLLEGFRCIAIEREPDYLPLITQRINRRRDPVAYLTAAGEDLGLFGDDA